MQKKIAILMLVHKDKKSVLRLIEHLSCDFDIYIHIDRRSSMEIDNRKGVHVYKRYKTYWGSLNITLATVFLMREAFQVGYDRYILISGQDLPIKTNQEIISFFNDNKKEYFKYKKLSGADKEGEADLDRVVKYWPNYSFFGNKNVLIKAGFYLRKIAFDLISRVRPRHLDFDFYKGAEWVNLTHNCLGKIFILMEENPKYFKRYKYTLCSDELFFQTTIKMVKGVQIVNDSLRYVNWSDGPERPRIMREEDFCKITGCECLFARKFDQNVDDKIIEEIYQRIS
ncbi:MAG: beta-1,6-N-acetylglucosaminyltransferase [Streptococcaceae bacterium]|jgi:hypothetical protein|nr:beta-1,6-N-acetylglucosaminyltransferase [Streptococcaceae bacterium]